MIKKIILTIFILTIVFTKSFGQSEEERTLVKEWLIANEENINLVSSKELNSMSPSIRDLVEKDSQFLIYDLIVSPKDIKKFEERNTNLDLVKFPTLYSEKSSSEIKEEKIKAEKEFVKDWLLGPGKDFKVISISKYNSLSEYDKKSLETEKLLIYKGNSLTSNDIKKMKK